MIYINVMLRKRLFAVGAGVLLLFITAQASAEFIGDFIQDTSETEFVQLDVVSETTDGVVHNGFPGSLLFGLSVDAGTSQISVSSLDSTSISISGIPTRSTEYTFNFSGRAGGGAGGSASIDMDVQYHYEVLIGVALDMSFGGSSSVQVLYTPAAPGSLEQMLFESTGGSGSFQSGFIGPGSLSIVGELDLLVLAPSSGLSTLFSGSLGLNLNFTGASPPVDLPGDLNGDGFVGIDDLNIILGSWNQTVPPGNPLADPSGDGFVGIEDLNVVLGAWNTGVPPAAGAVPEPTTLRLVGLPLVLFSRRRSRIRSSHPSI